MLPSPSAVPTSLSTSREWSWSATPIENILINLQERPSGSTAGATSRSRALARADTRWSVTRLTLLDNNLSYNWRPRLYSGIVKESLIDWLDYHQNDKDEWLRYGAGIYLSDVTIAVVRGNVVMQGMNGLLMTRTTGARVWNNNFSYNSGLGIGMYRASRNTVMHNWIDWNVRGYSDGFYNRGQDSAGLLIYEQSSNNIVAFNSVTHSGDGLFLWAGQSTMDTGTDGANDNLFYRNDFSFAPTNGMEATFSRNAFVENRVEGNWHGLWGGYSYDSQILGNRFSHNVEGISIEHGQGNTIAGNTFTGDTVAVHLWWNRIEPSDWGYPKHRDTHSTHYEIDRNAFTGNRTALRLGNTTEIHLAGNRYEKVDTVRRQTGDSSGLRIDEAAPRRAAPVVPARLRVAALPGGIMIDRAGVTRRDRSAIIVDEWGPYDWQSPKLWPAGRDDATPLRLRVLGPMGHWRVVARDGIASLSADAGRMGDTITVTPLGGRERDFSMQLEYVGVGTMTPFGELVPTGGPYRFGWRRFLPAAAWHLTFVPFDSTITARADPAAITRALHEVPRATLDTSRLDLTWYAPPRKAIPQANVLTQATATIALTPGRYLLRTIADDAVRVYVDDTLVIDDWKPGESHAAEATFTATGEHRFRIEHLQLDGWYELRLDIERAPR